MVMDDNAWIASLHRPEKKKTRSFYNEKERQLVSNVKLEEKKGSYVEENKKLAKKKAPPKFNEEEKKLVTGHVDLEKRLDRYVEEVKSPAPDPEPSSPWSNGKNDDFFDSFHSKDPTEGEDLGNIEFPGLNVPEAADNTDASLGAEYASDDASMSDHSHDEEYDEEQGSFDSGRSSNGSSVDASDDASISDHSQDEEYDEEQGSFDSGGSSNGSSVDEFASDDSMHQDDYDSGGSQGEFASDDTPVDEHQDDSGGSQGEFASDDMPIEEPREEGDEAYDEEKAVVDLEGSGGSVEEFASEKASFVEEEIDEEAYAQVQEAYRSLEQEFDEKTYVSKEFDEETYISKPHDGNGDDDKNGDDDSAAGSDWTEQTVPDDEAVYASHMSDDLDEDWTEEEVDEDEDGGFTLYFDVDENGDPIEGSLGSEWIEEEVFEDEFMSKQLPPGMQEMGPEERRSYFCMLGIAMACWCLFGLSITLIFGLLFLGGE